MTEKHYLSMYASVEMIDGDIIYHFGIPVFRQDPETGEMVQTDELRLDTRINVEIASLIRDQYTHSILDRAAEQIGRALMQLTLRYHPDLVEFEGDHSFRGWLGGYREAIPQPFNPRDN